MDGGGFGRLGGGGFDLSTNSSRLAIDFPAGPFSIGRLTPLGAEAASTFRIVDVVAVLRFSATAVKEAEEASLICCGVTRSVGTGATGIIFATDLLFLTCGGDSVDVVDVVGCVK